MKLKIKKYLKLSLCLLAPTLLGTSIAPILTSCSKEVDYSYTVEASENDVKNINGTRALVVPKPKINKETIYMYKFHPQNNISSFSEIYLPIINKLDFDLFHYNYLNDITSLKWYDGYENGLPKEVDPKNYQLDALFLQIEKTGITNLILPKVSLLHLHCTKSKVQWINLIGAINIRTFHVAQCQALTGLVFDENAVFVRDFHIRISFYKTHLIGTLKLPRFSEYPVRIPSQTFAENPHLEKVCLYGDESMYEIERGAFDSHILVEYYS